MSWQHKIAVNCKRSRLLYDSGFMHKDWILTRQHHTHMKTAQKSREIGLEWREWTRKRKYWTPIQQNVLKKDISHQNSSFWLSLLYQAEHSTKRRGLRLTSTTPDLPSIVTGVYSKGTLQNRPCPSGIVRCRYLRYLSAFIRSCGDSSTAPNTKSSLYKTGKSTFLF